MPYSSAFAPQTALEMTGLDYEAVKLDFPQTKTAEFFKLNPQGQVPVLIDGDLVLTHNWAIIFYLDKKFPEAKLFGSNLKTQAQAAKWLSFANADLHKAFVPLFRVPEVLKTEKEAFVQNATEQVLKLLKILDKALEAKKFVAGEEFTIADAYLFIELQWAKKFNLDLSECPNLEPYSQRVSELEVIKKTMGKQC